MKVIAGVYKSRNLKTVKGDSTRPTTSKNKENLFNMIGPYFQGGVALDLFAGSGSLGIEAISRGVNEAYFVDHSFQAFKVIQENLASLKIKNANVFKMDAFQALKKFRENELTFDLVFLDPPYSTGLSKKALNMLLDFHLLSKNAIVITEEEKSVNIEPISATLLLKKRVVYGKTILYIYEYQGECS